jgi:signal transduction histidine kinase
MNKNHYLKALLIACILIVGTLSFIQYYLVKNTYQLTRDIYYGEVKKRISELTSQPEMLVFAEQAQSNLRYTVHQYLDKKMSKAEFIRQLKQNNQGVHDSSTVYLNKMLSKNPELGGIKYKSQSDEITYQTEGKSDTLLRHRERPVIIVGEAFETINTILLNKDLTTSSGDELRIVVRQSNYIDVSSWQKEVYKRMSGILFLAIVLILAVIILFYLIFSAMIKQKKLADIKTDFANNITHELKTPLSSVSLILKSILRKDVLMKPKVLEELLQSLGRQHEKIRLIVDSVLESAMATAVVVEKEAVEITVFLHKYFHDLSLANHRLIVEIEPRLQILLTNEVALEKILNIFIDNAAKYSQTGSFIRVKSYNQHNHYYIEIIDQGRGIASEYHGDIFDKFYRIPEMNSHTVKGLGLGLYLAKQTAIQIGVELSLKSKPGSGSTFTITFPI